MVRKGHTHMVKLAEALHEAATLIVWSVPSHDGNRPARNVVGDFLSIYGEVSDMTCHLPADDEELAPIRTYIGHCEEMKYKIEIVFIASTCHLHSS